ncbi:MAG: LysR family transcriptional regulator [Acidiferrobacterales bacterium]
MARLPIGGLEVFLAIAKHGSLRRAAEALGVQSPAVSYQLKALEDRIGTALFIRTTRSVNLTDAGRSLLARAQPAMTELCEALEDARASGNVRKGTVRLTLPYLAYELTIAKKLAAFQSQFQEIELELSFNDAFEDIASEGFHAGVRLGEHIRDDMIAVRLSPPLKEVVFAAPSYFDKHGRPKQPKELLRHNCIRYRYIASMRFAEWQFHGAEGITTIDVRGNLIVNSTNALISAARAGLGIAWLFRSSVEGDLKAGTLESVLDSYSIERPGYFLYYPKANARIKVLREFIDFMRGQSGAP